MLKSRLFRPIAFALAAAFGLCAAVQAQQVKIYQIYGGGNTASSTYKGDFVVLFNAGGAAQSINGWSLQYASGTGTTWLVFNLTGAGSIPAGGYYLINTIAPTTGINDVPTPDFTPPSFPANLASTNGKLALVSNTTGIAAGTACPATNPGVIDYVSYGQVSTVTAPCIQVSRMANLSATAWATRNGDGCTDTNDDGADFTVGSATAPKNSASGLLPCPLPPGADLGVSMTSNPATQVNAGSSVNFTTTLSNFGPDPATGITLQITYPAGGTLGTTSPAPNSQAGNVLTYTIAGPLAAGASQMFSIDVTIPSGTSVSCSAAITASSPIDPGPSVNNVSRSLLVYDVSRARLFASTGTTATEIKRVDTASGAFVNFTSATGSWAGLAADDTRQVFWALSGTNLVAIPYYTGVPITVAPITFNGSTHTLNGLAFNGTTLYAVDNSNTSPTFEGIYSIAIPSGATTFVTDFRNTSQGDINATTDIKAIDWNFANGKLYGVNDATTAPSGKGLYEIDLGSGPGTGGLTFVTGGSYSTSAPGNASGDIDGLAIGGSGANNRAYLIIDEPGEIQIFDFTTSAFIAPNIPSPFAVIGSSGGGAFTDLVNSPPSGINLGLAATNPTNFTGDLPASTTYSFVVTNYGPLASGAATATFTLPAGATFVTSSPAGAPVGNMLTLAVPALGVGATANIDITLSESINGTYTVSGSVSGGGTELASWNNAAASVAVVDSRANLSIVLTTNGLVCAASPGNSWNTTYTITNIATANYATATNVVATFVIPQVLGSPASTPSGTFASGVLTVNLGDMPQGATAIVDLSGLVGSSPVGLSAIGASVAAALQNDPTPSNNSVNTATVNLVPTTQGGVQVLLKQGQTIPASGPLTADTTIDSTGDEIFSRPFASPTGSRWIMSVDSTITPTTQDRLLLRGTTNPFTFEVVAQEGVTALPGAGDLIGEPNYGMGINSSGQFGFSCDTDGSTTSDEVVVRGDGTSFTVVAREGDSCPGIGGANYGATSQFYGIREGGSISFTTNLVGPTTANDTAVLDADGVTVLAQEGITIPGGASAAYSTFISGAASDSQLGTVNGIGGYTLNATLAGSLNALAVNGSVVLIDNQTLPGMSDPISSIPFNYQASNGDWYATIQTSTGAARDACVRNGVVLSKTDDPIIPGSTELWDDALYGQTFFCFVGNASGTYVVGGVTNNPARLNNAVFTVNGNRVLMRENDPVDLDGNGLFDDDAYLNVFRDDRMFLTDDGWLYFTAGIRNGSQVCNASEPTAVQRIFARINTAAQNVRCCRGATCTFIPAASCVTTGVTAAGTATSTVAGTCATFVGGTPSTFQSPCCLADYNKANAVSVQDILDFIQDWLAGRPYAVTGGTGSSGTPAVQDLLNFFTAWLAGNCP